MKSLKYLLFGLAVAASPRAFGQAAINQVDDAQQRRRMEQSANGALQPGDTASEIYDGENSDVGPQTVVSFSKGPRHTWVQASADELFYHTDNMFELDKFTQEADVFLTTIEADLTPPAVDFEGGKLTPRLGYRHQFYSFGVFGEKVDGSTVGLDTFDFNAGTAFADATWQRGPWVLGGGFDYIYLMNNDSGDEFYSEYVARWNAGYNLPLCDRAAAYFSYDGDYRWTDSDGSYLLAGGRSNMDRTDHALTASVNYKICNHAILQPYYQFRFTEFTGSPARHDFVNTVGLGLYLPICDHAGVRLYTSYATRDVEGSSAEDYNKLDFGGGVTLTFRF